MNTDLQTLKMNLSNLQPGDLKFAASLIDQMDRRANLSPKQWNWVTTLARRATGAEPMPAKAELPSMSGVIALFAKAQEHLKHPKVRLQLDDGSPLCLSIAGAQSRAPGSVNLTDGGRFGSNVWYGRVSPEGKWDQGKSVDGATAAKVTALLCELAADPAGVASRHGRLTGNCCFCNTGLTDARSTEVGYGPICARHYGLPWGTPSKGECSHAQTSPRPPDRHRAACSRNARDFDRQSLEPDDATALPPAAGGRQSHAGNAGWMEGRRQIKSA